MPEFEYVKGQEKRVDRKYDELRREAEHMLKEGEIDKIEDKYEKLLEKRNESGFPLAAGGGRKVCIEFSGRITILLPHKDNSD